MSVICVSCGTVGHTMGRCPYRPVPVPFPAAAFRPRRCGPHTGEPVGCGAAVLLDALGNVLEADEATAHRCRLSRAA